jgi:hypothetical protein
MSLAQLQQIFWECVRDRREKTNPEVAPYFVDYGALSGPERIQIYRNMYWYRQVDVLWESFPVLAQLLSKEKLTKLICTYLEEHPSENPQLEFLGSRLPAFMKLCIPEIKKLYDIVLLEWEREVSFLATNPPSLARVSDIQQETFAHSTVTFVPALRTINCKPSSLRIWDEVTAALDKEETVPAIDVPDDDSEARVPVVIWRTEFVVYHLALSEDEDRALKLAQAGKTLAEVCDSFASHPDAIMRAFEVIRSWLQKQWVSSIDLGEAQA